ncbi:hypothetical protein LP420_21720 [Massilia sp. B-10]|nr:hypothetical protein LP420_21720 [Massilia sp. B-10]
MARGALALATATLMVLLTDRGDKAVREQAALLRPVLAALPLPTGALFALARAVAALPALLVTGAVCGGSAPRPVGLDRGPGLAGAGLRGAAGAGGHAAAAQRTRGWRWWSLKSSC